MSNHQTPTPGSDADNPIIPTRSTSEYVPEVEDNQPQPTNETANPDAPQTESSERSNRNKRKIPVFEIITLLINGILAYYTYQLFLKTKDSTDAAIKSANAAVESNRINKEALNDYRKNSESADKRQKTLDTIAEEERKRNFIRDTTTLGIQINSLKETKKEFELESRAFIQIADISLDTSKLKEPFPMHYKYIDVGKFPAKIYQVRSIGIFDTSVIGGIDDPEKRNDWRIDSRQHIVSTSTQSPQSIYILGLTEKEYGQMINGIGFLYFCWEIKFRSIGIDKNYFLRIKIRVRRDPLLKMMSYETVEYLEKEI